MENSVGRRRRRRKTNDVDVAFRQLKEERTKKTKFEREAKKFFFETVTSGEWTGEAPLTDWGSALATRAKFRQSKVEVRRSEGFEIPPMECD